MKLVSIGVYRVIIVIYLELDKSTSKREKTALDSGCCRHADGGLVHNHAVLAQRKI